MMLVSMLRRSSDWKREMGYLVDFDFQVPARYSVVDEPADLGNTGWRAQLGYTGVSHGASALLMTWSTG